VDDHPLFRQGVVDALTMESDLKVVGQSASGSDALELIRSLKPAVAVLDVNLPGLNGQQITHSGDAGKNYPHVVLLVTGYDDIEQALHAALAGAAAYCSKNIEPQNLIQIIREVADGKFYIWFGDFECTGIGWMGK